MGFNDILDLIKIKNSGNLDELDSFDEEKKGLFSEIFEGKADALKNKIDVLNEETETSKRTAEILEGTVFKNKFNEIYDDDIEGQRKFEIFNRKISYVVKSYIDGLIPSYEDGVRVELATGFQFVLMQKMSELGATDTADFFANFSGEKVNGLKGIITGLFTGLNNSSGFVTVGQRLQNFLYFLDEYKGGLGDLKNLRAGHIPNILLDDAKSTIWDSWSNIENKSFDEIKTQIPLITEINENTERADLKEIANTSVGALNQKLLEALSSERGNGGALAFASKFLQIRPKLKNFLAKPIKLASKIFDNSFLGKQFLGGKTVVEYLQDKHNGKTMDLVLGIIGFRGGWKGLKDHLEDPEVESPDDVTNPSDVNKPPLTPPGHGEDLTNISVVSGVAAYIDYTAGQIEKTESAKKYDAINTYDVTGVSLGKLQRHDVLAQKLMQFMQKKNQSEFNEIMGAEFVGLMNKGMKESGNIWKSVGGWENSPANREKRHPEFLPNFKKLMSRSEFEGYMDEFMKQTTKKYIQLAKKSGVTDPASVVYFSRLCNRGPVKAKEFWNKSDKTLAGLHAITQRERAGDANNPLGRIYNPLFADLQKTDFSSVSLDDIV